MPESALRLLVTGGTGLLGGEVLAAALCTPGILCAGTYHRAAPPAGAAVEWFPLDLVDPGALTRDDAGALTPLFAAARPDVVLHAAVATAPGALEPVIVEGSARVARAAHAASARLIHVSSDMVFDGASGPFAEDSPVSPITDYGRAKARAEERVREEHPGAVIVRASLLYRLAPPDRSLFGWLESLAAGSAYPLFTDEIRCPAHVEDVAHALVELSLRMARGEEVPRVLHAVGPEAISRYAFGELVLRALGRDPALAVPARSADSGLVRPRELRLTTRGTPAWFVAGLRAPRQALSEAAARVPRTRS